jgi:hypothetical protein
MAKRRELTPANVSDVLTNVIGYDPDLADWPGTPGVVAPDHLLVEEVVEELGWSPRSRHARICVGSIMQAMMRTAAD